MRLSEIKGERVFEAVADIIGPVADIAQDEHARKMFDAEGGPFAERVKANLPALLRDHSEEFASIIAVINGTTAEEYMAEVTLPKLFSDVFELLTDKEFASFFD